MMDIYLPIKAGAVVYFAGPDALKVSCAACTTYYMYMYSILYGITQ